MPERADRRGDARRYVVRRYRDGDRAGVLSLYEAAGRARSPEWFAWRFEHNPFLSHVPVFVAADRDGDLVGALPVAAVRLSAPRGTVLGLGVGDILLRPGHADRDLRSRLMAACADHYAGTEPHVRFGFAGVDADAGTVAGRLSPDARVAGEVPTCYRVRDPTALVDDARRRLAPALAPVAAGYLELRDRLVTVGDDATVYRYTDLPLDRLCSLYRRAVPETFHAHRNPSYYRWRFSDPDHPATTYVATLDDDPAAAVVTYGGTADGYRTVKLAEMVPLRPASGRTVATKAILAAIVEEHADADLFVACGDAFPADALRAFGFHPDTAPPLSAVTNPTVLVVAPPGGRSGTVPDRWTFGERSIDDVTNWTVTFGDRDAA
jgi:hypothetical protein